jgi:hypothetical protein
MLIKHRISSQPSKLSIRELQIILSPHFPRISPCAIFQIRFQNRPSHIPKIRYRKQHNSGVHFLGSGCNFNHNSIRAHNVHSFYLIILNVHLLKMPQKWVKINSKMTYFSTQLSEFSYKHL